MNERSMSIRPEALTSMSQTFYPKARSIFSMAEGGEVPASSIGPPARTQPRLPRSRTGVSTQTGPKPGELGKPEEKPISQGLSKADLARTAQIGREMQELSGAPAFQEGAREVKEKEVSTRQEEQESMERYWMRLARQGRITEGEAERNIREGRLPRMAGGQLGYPDLPRTGVDALDNIVDQANRRPPDQRGETPTITRQLERVERLIDEGRVAEDQAREILNGLEGWRIEAINEQMREREEEMRAREEERVREGGLYGQRILTQEDKELIVQGGPDADRLFNRLFYRADAEPRSQFREALATGGEFEHQDFKKVLAEALENAQTARNQREVDRVQKLIEKYDAEYKLRELLHDAYYVAEIGGEVRDFAGHCSRFASEFADLTFLGAPEVEVATRIREQVLYQIKRENDGFIPYEKVAYDPVKKESEFERRTRDLLRDANEKRLLGGTEPLEEWQLARALSLSRGFGMVTLRLPEIVAETILSAPPEKYESQRSIPWETITWELNMLDHKFKRYNIGKEMRAILYTIFTAGDKRKKLFDWWNQDELRQLLDMDAITAFASLEGRGIDIRNLFRIGGPFTHTGWRSYVSALDEHSKELKPLLMRNPGLALRLLWNRYEKHDLIEFRNKYREDLIRDLGVSHRDWSEEDIKSEADRRISKEWQELKKEHQEEEDKKWKGVDISEWEKATRRIPHVILRIITDKTNRLLNESEREALWHDIFGMSPKDPRFQGLYTQTESDLTFVKEHMLKRRRDAQEAGRAFDEAEDKLLPEDFDVIVDPNQSVNTADRRATAQRLMQVVERQVSDNQDNQSLRKMIFDSIEKRKIPFVLTTEDIPYGELRFIQTGGRGFITRRINDFHQDVQANTEIINLVNGIRHYHTPEQIVEQLDKIYHLAEIHDPDRAADAVTFLTKGIIRLYQKDWFVKIPVAGEIISAINAIRHRGDSFAETVFGEKAMDWDSDDIYNFTEQLRQILPLEKVQQLRKETGGQLWQALGTKTKLAFYLLFIFGLYEFARRVIQEK